MTAPEYVQLKAFARIDGLRLSILLMLGFVCYVVGLTSPTYGFLAIITVIVTPFFVGRQLKRFRDNGLDGAISFLRGWAYVALMFFYGGLLFALAQFSRARYIARGPKSEPPIPIWQTVVYFSPFSFTSFPECTEDAKSAIFFCCST